MKATFINFLLRKLGRSKKLSIDTWKRIGRFLKRSRSFPKRSNSLKKRIRRLRVTNVQTERLLMCEVICY